MSEAEKEIVRTTDKVILPIDDFYEIGDVKNLKFAQMARVRLEERAMRNGLARRILNTTLSGNTDQDVKITFEDPESPNTPRFDSRKGSIIVGESNHYVREDTTLLDMIRKNLPEAQIIEATFEEFTPQLLARARALVASLEIPVAHCYMHANIWNSFIADEQFTNLIDPVTRYEELMHGHLGSVFGVQLNSDAFAHPLHKILQPGEMFFFGSAERLGRMTVMGEKMGMMIETEEDGAVVWSIPHDFHITDLEMESISLLRLK